MRPSSRSSRVYPIMSRKASLAPVTGPSICQKITPNRPRSARRRYRRWNAAVCRAASSRWRPTATMSPQTRDEGHEGDRSLRPVEGEAALGRRGGVPEAEERETGGEHRRTGAGRDGEDGDRGDEGGAEPVAGVVDPPHHEADHERDRHGEGVADGRFDRGGRAGRAVPGALPPSAAPMPPSTAGTHPCRSTWGCGSGPGGLAAAACRC